MILKVEVHHYDGKEIRIYHHDDQKEKITHPIQYNVDKIVSTKFENIDETNDVPWKIRKKLKKDLPILLEDIQDRRKFYDRNDLLKIVTPPWADKNEIKQVYEEAKRLTTETGIIHNVDHIIPLKHPLVCGLHVKENLRVVTREENYKKNNKFIIE